MTVQDNKTELTEILNIVNELPSANALSGLTATVDELNILDGVTATTDELNYLDGVTSNIQTQINNKPNYTYSTTDIGVNASLETGKLYFVYE